MSKVVDFKKDIDGDNKDYSAVANLVNQIEAEQSKIDDINEEAKRAKAPHQDTIAAKKKVIRDEHGIEAKALSALVAKRRQERRMKDRISNLDETASNQFKQMEMAL